MFGTGSLDAATLLGLGLVLVAIGGGARLAASAGFDPFPVPVVVGLAVSAAGPLHGLRPEAPITRSAAEIGVVLLLFGLGFDHGGADRRAAAATLAPGPALAADAALNVVPGVVVGLLAGFGPTGAALLGGVTGASSWTMATRLLDREGRFGNRETPAVLAVLVHEHTATAMYLPLAAALLAPGGAAARWTAVLGSAAAVTATLWLTVGPGPLPGAGLLGDSGLLDGPGRRTGSALLGGSGAAGPLLLAGVVFALAGIAAWLGVATAGIAYLAGVVLASADRPPSSDAGAAPPSDRDGLRRAVALLRDLGGVAAGLTLGLLIPAARLPGALAGGALLAGLTAVTRLATGWWATGQTGPIGRAGRLRAGVALVPRGELAVAIGVLAALSAPGRGPGTALAALAAVEVVLTGFGPAALRRAGDRGWYRWAVPAPATARPEPPEAG